MKKTKGWWCWLTGGMDWEEKVEIVGLVGENKNKFKKTVDRGLGKV